MKQSFQCVFVCLLAAALFSTAGAQTGPDINYDEAKIPPYTLPDPLLLNGKKIKTKKEWTETQKPYLLRQFQEQVYGKLPPKTADQYFKVVSVDEQALGGKAIRKQVRAYFSKGDTTAGMDILLYLPRNAPGKIPVFTGLNFAGNQTIHTDPGILLSRSWIASVAEYKSEQNKATEASRGIEARRWPVEELVARGYGLATVYYGDLEPDHSEGWQTGIRSSLQSSLSIKPEEWSAIGAWAWGLSRIMDYLETEEAVNTNQVAITGHSRLGKAALWAAANDERFALIVANESGEGGAALAKRWYGETTARINTTFPHWFVPAFKQYNGRPELLPVDQHQLLALLAPRPLYVASAEDDQWADPKGEFLGAKGAEPAYALFGKKGLGTATMPPVNKPVGNTIRYHIRTGKHDMLLYDWMQFMQFADTQFGRPAQKNATAAGF